MTSRPRDPTLGLEGPSRFERALAAARGAEVEDIRSRALLAALRARSLKDWSDGDPEGRFAEPGDLIVLRGEDYRRLAREALAGRQLLRGSD